MRWSQYLRNIGQDISRYLDRWWRRAWTWSGSRFRLVIMAPALTAIPLAFLSAFLANVIVNARISFRAPRIPVGRATTYQRVTNAFRCFHIGWLLLLNRLSHFVNRDVDLGVRTKLQIFFAVAIANGVHLHRVHKLKRTKSCHVSLRYVVGVRVVGLVAAVVICIRVMIDLVVVVCCFAL